jgi:hypothetical protein
MVKRCQLFPKKKMAPVRFPCHATFFLSLPVVWQCIGDVGQVVISQLLNFQGELAFEILGKSFSISHQKIPKV